MNVRKLPSIDKFYSRLTGKNISEEVYERAHTIWKLFKCKTLLDYTKLYLKSDVLILSYVAENFRNVCLNNYKLDPLHFFSAPGLTWEAFLKHSEAKIPLFSDEDMYTFIEKGIRSGVSQCIKRYAKANNKYMKNFDKTKPSNYLMYLDANNLYGWAMSQQLPEKDFTFINIPENLKENNSLDYYQ